MLKAFKVKLLVLLCLTVVGCGVGTRHTLQKDVEVCEYAFQWIGKSINDYPNLVHVIVYDNGRIRYCDTYDPKGPWLHGGHISPDLYAICFDVDALGFIYNAQVSRVGLDGRKEISFEPIRR